MHSSSYLGHSYIANLAIAVHCCTAEQEQQFQTANWSPAFVHQQNKLQLTDLQNNYKRH